MFITVRHKDSKELLSIKAEDIQSVGTWRVRSMIIGENKPDTVGSLINTKGGGQVEVLNSRVSILNALDVKDVIAVEDPACEE